MNKRRKGGYIFFCLFAILFTIGVWNAAGIYEASATTAQSPVNTSTLVLVLVAVLIVIAMIFIYRLPENRYKNEAALANYEMQEIASVKTTIGKIKSLEKEKKSLLLEIEELKEKSEAKATTLETEVNTLQNNVKSLKTLALPEPR